MLFIAVSFFSPLIFFLSAEAAADEKQSFHRHIQTINQVFKQYINIQSNCCSENKYAATNQEPEAPKQQIKKKKGRKLEASLKDLHGSPVLPGSIPAAVVLTAHLPPAWSPAMIPQSS